MKSFNTNFPSKGPEKVFSHQARSQGWILLELIVVYALIMMFGLWYGRYPHLLAGYNAGSFHRFASR